MAVTAPAPGNPLQEFYERPDVPLRSGPDRARRQARMLAGMLRDVAGPAVIIDLGCGDGAALAVAAGTTRRTGSPGSTGPATRLRQAQALGLTVVRASVAAASLPVADGAADVVIMSELIEHLVDPDGAVAEARRILRPGGSLLLSTPNLAAWYNRGLLAAGIQPVFSEVSLRGVFGRPGRVVAGHLRLFTRRALTEFLTASGFRCVTVTGARYHDVPRPLARSTGPSAGGRPPRPSCWCTPGRNDSPMAQLSGTRTSRAMPLPAAGAARTRDWRPGHRDRRRAGHRARLASLHAGPPARPGRVQQPPARARSWPIGTFRLIGGAGPGRAGCGVGRLLRSCHLCRLGRRRRRLRHPAELLAARLVLLRHLSRPGRSYHRLLTPQRVPAQLGGRADQDRAGQHVRHPDRRRRLYRPGRRAGRRGPRGRGAPGGIPTCRPTGTGKRTASAPEERSSSSTTITWAAPFLTSRDGTVIATFPVSQLSSAGHAAPVRRGGPARPDLAAVLHPAGQAAPRSCGARRCCRRGTRSTSTARRARTCRPRAASSTWPGSRCRS